MKKTFASLTLVAAFATFSNASIAAGYTGEYATGEPSAFLDELSVSDGSEGTLDRVKNLADGRAEYQRKAQSADTNDMVAAGAGIK